MPVYMLLTAYRFMDYVIVVNCGITIILHAQDFYDFCTFGNTLTKTALSFLHKSENCNFQHATTAEQFKVRI